MINVVVVVVKLSFVRETRLKIGMKKRMKEKNRTRQVRTETWPNRYFLCFKLKINQRKIFAPQSKWNGTTRTHNQYEMHSQSLISLNKTNQFLQHTIINAQPSHGFKQTTNERVSTLPARERDGKRRNTLNEKLKQSDGEKKTVRLWINNQPVIMTLIPI